jgi:hypothetical protein
MWHARRAPGAPSCGNFVSTQLARGSLEGTCMHRRKLVTNTSHILCGALTSLLLLACSGDKDKSKAEPKPEPKPAPEAKAPPPEPEAKPEPVEQKEIDPADLPPALAKVHEATSGIDSTKGGFAKFHKAVIEKHGEPTLTKELYGKPAYFWAAREGDVCVKFGYPSPSDPKSKMWTTWQPSIVQPPPEGLEFGEKMHAERNWNECISYAEGKEPE